MPLEREAQALVARARLSVADEAARGRRPSPHPPPSTRRPGSASRPASATSSRWSPSGRTNRQIGEALFITENTAGVHVSNILAKFGVSGRGEAAAMAYHLGLVDPAAVPLTEEAGG